MIKLYVPSASSGRSWVSCFDVEARNSLYTTFVPGGVLYSVEQFPRCDLLRLSLLLGDSFRPNADETPGRRGDYISSRRRCNHTMRVVVVAGPWCRRRLRRHALVRTFVRSFARSIVVVLVVSSSSSSSPSTDAFVCSFVSSIVRSSHQSGRRCRRCRSMVSSSSCVGACVRSFVCSFVRRRTSRVVVVVAKYWCIRLFVR